MVVTSVQLTPQEERGVKRAIVDTAGDGDDTSRVLMIERRGILIDEVRTLQFACGFRHEFTTLFSLHTKL